MQLAVGPVVGTHTARLCQTAHLLQPVFPGKKRSVWMKTGFVVQCSFSALEKLTVNTG